MCGKKFGFFSGMPMNDFRFRRSIRGRILEKRYHEIYNCLFILCLEISHDRQIKDWNIIFKEYWKIGRFIYLSLRKNKLIIKEYE